MATITATATYPDNLQIDLRDTLALRFGYQEIINGEPNPQSKAAFIQQFLNDNFKEYLKNQYRYAKQDIAIKSINDLTIS